jgi:hypothetical protein
MENTVLSLRHLLSRRNGFSKPMRRSTAIFCRRARGWHWRGSRHPAGTLDHTMWRCLPLHLTLLCQGCHHANDMERGDPQLAAGIGDDALILERSTNTMCRCPPLHLAPLCQGCQPCRRHRTWGFPARGGH